MKEAYETLAKNQEDFVDYLKEVILERYDNLYNDAVEKKDLKAAAAILKQISDLFGLNIEKKEVTVKDTNFEITFK